MVDVYVIKKDGESSKKVDSFHTTSEAELYVAGRNKYVNGEYQYPYYWIDYSTAYVV